MFDDRFRRFLAPLLTGPAQRLGKIGVTANHLTIFGFLLGTGGAVGVALHRPWLGMGLWLGSRVLDGLDGVVARVSAAATPFGGFLDLTLDMAAYSLMAVAFALVHPGYQLVWLLVLVGYVLCITTAAVLAATLERQQVVLPGIDRSIQLTPGFAEAGETTTFYLLVTVFPGWVGPLATGWVVVLLATAVQRTLLARRLLAPPLRGS